MPLIFLLYTEHHVQRALEMEVLVITLGAFVYSSEGHVDRGSDHPIRNCADLEHQLTVPSVRNGPPVFKYLKGSCVFSVSPSVY